MRATHFDCTPLNPVDSTMFRFYTLTHNRNDYCITAKLAVMIIREPNENCRCISAHNHKTTFVNRARHTKKNLNQSLFLLEMSTAKKLLISFVDSIENIVVRVLLMILLIRLNCERKKKNAHANQTRFGCCCFFSFLAFVVRFSNC